MKKVYFLSLILCAVLGLNAQTVVLSEDFSGITDSSGYVISNLDNCTQVPGWTGEKVYPSNGKVKLGTSSVAGYIQTPALDLSANGGQFTVTFDAKIWNGDNTSMFVYVNDVPYTVSGLSSSQFNTFSLPLTGGTSTTTVKFQSFVSNRGRFFLDNVVIVSEAAGPDVTAPFVASVNPSDNALAVTFNEVLDATSAQNVANYSLDNNIAVTSATLNGRVVTLAVNPALVEGNTYTLIVNNVADTAGNVMTTPDTVVFTYGVAPEFYCATIADLRSKLDFTDVSVNNPSTVEYKLTGEVVVTAVAAHNNQKVLQDETGAILVYDPDNALGTLDVGDKVKNIYGTLTNYFGFLELKPTQAYGTLVSMFEDVTPMTVTLAQLNDPSFMIQHQAELIKLENVSFTSQGQFAVLNTYEITQNGTTASAVFPYFQDASTIGQDIPTGVINIVGFNFATSKIGSTYLDYRYYIVPRSMNDFGTGINNYVSENDVTIAPNPAVDYMNVTVKNDNFQVNHCYVVDINGKVVSAQNVENNNFSVNVSSMASGLYFLRLTDGKSNVTTKFIKK